MDDVLIGTGRLPEKSASDAPCHLSLAEAETWASGWNAAAQALDEMLATPCPQCSGVGYFGDPADGQNCKACHGSGVLLNEQGQPA